jgi:molybdopterin-biosynthesis enzyme MoeA-like protein
LNYPEDFQPDRHSKDKQVIFNYPHDIRHQLEKLDSNNLFNEQYFVTAAVVKNHEKSAYLVRILEMIGNQINPYFLMKMKSDCRLFHVALPSLMNVMCHYQISPVDDNNVPPHSPPVPSEYLTLQKYWNQGQR